MARCRCSGAFCGCFVQAGQGILFSGSGNQDDPWVISAPVRLTGGLVVSDTPDINLTLSGVGTASAPYVVSGVVTAFATGTTGQVLTKQADGTWHGAPAVTAAPGSISVGSGLAGDGSAGAPLRVSGLCTYANLKAHCT